MKVSATFSKFSPLNLDVSTKITQSNKVKSIICIKIFSCYFDKISNPFITHFQIIEITLYKSTRFKRRNTSEQVKYCMVYCILKNTIGLFPWSLIYTISQGEAVACQYHAETLTHYGKVHQFNLATLRYILMNIILREVIVQFYILRLIFAFYSVSK